MCVRAVVVGRLDDVDLEDVGVFVVAGDEVIKRDAVVVNLTNKSSGYHVYDSYKPSSCTPRAGCLLERPAILHHPTHVFAPRDDIFRRASRLPVERLVCHMRE